MTIQISITGEPGCGKTTVAMALATALSAKFMSTGAIQRELAAARGITTLELNKIAENDKSIDLAIDQRTQALDHSPDSFVIDSRLAWRFLPRSLKVFLVCPPAVAAGRVFAEQRALESFESRESAIDSLVQRHESEKLRFLTYYGASLRNLRNYDLVVDTAYADPATIVAAIVEVAQAKAEDAVKNQAQSGSSEVSPRERGDWPQLFLSPKSLMPTKDFAVGMASGRPMQTSVVGVDVCRVAGAWALVDGHQRVAAALQVGTKLIPARLAGLEDEVLGPSITARAFAERHVTAARVAAWEAAFGFRFAETPVFAPR